MKTIYSIILATSLLSTSCHTINHSNTLSIQEMVGVSKSMSWDNTNTPQMIAQASADSLSFMELSTQLFNTGKSTLSRDELEKNGLRFKEELDKKGITLWSIHLPFTRKLDISVIDSAKRAENVAFIKSMMEYTGKMKPQRFVLHPSSEPIKPEEREQRIKNCIESIGLLYPVAKKMGIKLCIENLPRTCLGNNAEELLRIVAPYPELGICFDTNHFAQGNPADFVRIAGKRIATVHISDCDGIDERHWIPYEGVINWKDVMTELQKVHYPGPYIFELRSPAKDGKHNYSSREIRNAYLRMCAEIK